jgi:Domain of unknown function (DUF2341)
LPRREEVSALNGTFSRTARTMTGGKRMKTKHAERLLVLALSLVSLLSAAQPSVSAKPAVSNFLKGTSLTNGDLKMYDYTTPGNTALYTTQADFNTGSFAGTSSTVSPGNVTLAPALTGFAYQTCYSIDHTAPAATTVTEYPVSVTLDTAALVAAGKMQATGADIRGVSSAGALVPVWIEGPINTTTTVIWVQVPTITAGTNSGAFCIAYGNPTATTVSNPVTPFSYSSLKKVYYPISQRYTTNPTSVAVASYAPGNQVKSGATTISLATVGAVGSLPAASILPNQAVEVLGPISSRGVGATFDALAPVSFAGTKFVDPLTYGGALSISILAPFVTAKVVVLDGTVPVAGSPFTIPAGTSVAISGAFTANSLSAVINSDVPVLVSSATATGLLNVTPIEQTTQTLYGVRNGYVDFGFSAAGTANVIFSNGTTQAVAGAIGADVFQTGSGSVGGNAAEGMAVTGTVPISVFADSNSDAATFLPKNELASTYILPVAANYVTFACPTVGTVITIGSLGSVNCTTTGAGPFPTGTPGKALYTAAIPAGTTITASTPFYMYYASAGLETNVWGPKQGRQVTYPAPAPAVVVPGNTWTSQVITSPGTGIYGTISWNATLPSGASLSVKVAAAATALGPWAYVGPDGTGATSFTISPGATPFTFDGLGFARIQVTFTAGTGSPVLSDITVGYNLPQLAHTAGTSSGLVALSPIGAARTSYLLRIKTSTTALNGTTITVKDIVTGTSVGNLSAATLRLESPVSNQVIITGGVVTQPVGPPAPFATATPLNLAFVSTATAASVTNTLAVNLAAKIGTVTVDNDLLIAVTS